MSGDEPGATFGPYELREPLGRGGCGEVARAIDTRTDAEVALKRLITAREVRSDIRDRFRREVDLTRRLSSVHVIPIYDSGEIEGRLYLEMRLVSGGDLSRRSRGHMDPQRAVRIVEQIAHALDAAHRVGMVHRDVKPANILVDDVADDIFCYLTDFGIARLIDESEQRLSITPQGKVVGTPQYMAPELFRGSRYAGPASDVYALGCVLYELLTHRPPFPGADWPSLRHQHREEKPAPPSSLAPVPSGFDAVVARAMAKRTVDRFDGAVGLAEAARGALRTPVASHPARRTTRRQAPASSAAGASATASSAASGGGVAASPGRRARRAVVAGALIAALGGVGVVALISATSAPPTLGPRPATLAVHGRAACSLMSRATQESLGLGTGFSLPTFIYPDGPARCQWSPPSFVVPGMQPLPDFSRVAVVRLDESRTAQDALRSTASPEVVTVRGFSAVQAAADDSSADASCSLVLDAGPTSSIIVEYELTAEDARPGHDVMCARAQQIASDVVANLGAS